MLNRIWFILLIVLCLLLPAAAVCEWETVAENDRLVLAYDPQESQIMLTDRVTGEIWRSTPEDIAQDTVASGMNKINRQSDLIVTFHNPTYVTNQVNSYTGSIKNGDFTWEKIENGVEIRYYFPKQGFLIPVRYELEEDGLKASVLSQQIQENVWTLSENPEDIEKAASGKDKQSVMTVSLLPFMGAAGTGDEGYLVIPDGSGALIHFNNGRSSAAAYQQDVFGRDSTLSVKKAATRTFQVNMPLFGMIRNGFGMMAVVDQGAAQAQLNAAVSGQLTGYNNAYFTVTYISMESNTLMAGSSSSKSVTLAANTFRDMGDFVVRYYLLDKENADYTDIAALYRSQLKLTDHTGTPAGTQLKMVASIPSIKTFIGIPYNSVTVLTSYGEAADVLTDLHQAGVEGLTLQYAGWSSQSVQGRMVTGLDLDGRLGGQDGFNRLLSAAENTSSGLTLSVDLVNLYKNGNGYWSLFSAADNVNSTARIMNEYLMSTGAQDPSGKSWYLLRPDVVKDAAEKLASSLSGKLKEHTGVTLTALGKTLYSSLGKNGISRTASGAYWQKAFEALQTSVPYLTAETPSSYAFPYLIQADGTPMASSRYDVTDTDIPFYQLVVHGAMVMYTEPLNELGNIEDAVLKMAEYGVYPAWRLIYRDPALLSGTDGADWYATSVSAWREDVIRVAEQMKQLSHYASMSMTGHERLTADLSVTTYENGDRVYVNYGNTDAQEDGITVPARSFTIREVE